MEQIPSKLEGMQFDLYKLEQKLKPIGYSIGGNWDYDHGFFDYKINDQDGYQYLRLPFTAVDGQLDVRNCTVELGRPFVLNHVYEGGIDEEAESGVITGSFSQFQDPADKDGSLSDRYIEIGKRLVAELEETISSIDHSK